jgi:hypothetical protein
METLRTSRSMRSRSLHREDTSTVDEPASRGMRASAKLGHSAPRELCAAADHTFTPLHWPGFAPPLTSGSRLQISLQLTYSSPVIEVLTGLVMKNAVPNRDHSAAITVPAMRPIAGEGDLVGPPGLEPGTNEL